MATTQLVFNFATSPDVSAASYLPLHSHQPALQLLHILQGQGGFRGCRIVGESGAGKTHMLKAWAGVTGATLLTPDLQLEPPLNAVGADDILNLTPQEQEQLFHTYNYLQKQNGLLVVTSQTPLQPDTPLLPDLRTRLLTLPQVELLPPTDADLTQLLLKWAQDAALTLKPDVIKYILNRAERSALKLNRLVHRLDTLSLVEKKGVTLPLARQALSEGESEQSQ